MRPALRYMGSKLKLAPWVVEHFPRHRLYCEPFGGGAGVLLSKLKSRIEVYNDANGEVVNFFRVLRDQPDELVQKLRFTPYARAEYELAYEPTDDVVERARRTCIKAWMSVGPKGLSLPSASAAGFRRCSAKNDKSEPQSFVSCVDHLYEASERLRSVVVECRDALNLLDHYDSPDTLFYCDPPYSADYCGKYAAKIDHAELLNRLCSLKGFCVLSGYGSPLYSRALASWHMESRPHKAFLNKDAVECLWLSPRTWDALQREREPLLA